MIGACGRLRDPCGLQGGLNEIPAKDIADRVSDWID
jgi:hypothetical protein